MPLIWLSAVCAAIMVILLVLGERTLPLMGGDREFAGRLYKTLFMVLITGFVVGLIPLGARTVANFLRVQVEKIAEQDGLFAAWRRFVTGHDIPGIFEAVAPWLAMAMGIAGLVLAAVIWTSE